jgi:hypothetical protein
MNPIRQVIEDAPEFFPIPQELRHRKVEIILWPLDEKVSQTASPSSDYERTQVDRIEIPSREERNARR